MKIGQESQITSGRNSTIYKPPLGIMGGGLTAIAILFFGLTLPAFIAGTPIQSSQALGLAGFWLIGLAVTFVPLGGRLEVGEDYITTYLFGFRTTPKIHRSAVESTHYGNMMAGGLGFGRGVKFWATVNGRSRPYSISEMTYGKEAVAHVRRVLSS